MHEGVKVVAQARVLCPPRQLGGPAALPGVAQITAADWNLMEPDEWREEIAYLIRRIWGRSYDGLPVPPPAS